MRIKQRPVNMLTINNGKPRVMKTDNTGSAINDAGNRKQLSQEPKLIEEIFLQDYNKKFGLKEKEPRGVYALLDHVVKRTPTGFREFELNKVIDYLAQREAVKNGRNFPNREDVQVGQQKFNREIGNLMGFMNSKKNNMYYYGGRGDASRLYFVKYHPNTPVGVTAVRKAMTSIKAALKKSGVSAKDIKEIDKSRQEFIKKFSSGIGSAKKAGEMFDKSFVSNAIYDARLNGYRGLQDIAKVLGKGYINDAKAFNKRSQIWFTSGYSSDPEAVSMAIEKARGGKGDVKDGILNIKIVEDNGKEIPHKLGTANSE